MVKNIHEPKPDHVMIVPLPVLLPGRVCSVGIKIAQEGDSSEKKVDIGEVYGSIGDITNGRHIQTVIRKVEYNIMLNSNKSKIIICHYLDDTHV